MQRSIRVFYPNATTGTLETRLASGMPEQAFGVTMLLEKVAKLLYTQTNSNFFSPELGSPIGNKQVGSTTDKLQVELMLHNSIQSIAAQIINEQTTEGTNIDPEQQLVSLDISNIYQSDDTTAWYVEVIVRTATNQTYFITV